jgi:hypothetical protein
VGNAPDFQLVFTCLVAGGGQYLLLELAGQTGVVSAGPQAPE